MNKNKIIVIVGPTASGKTKLSVEIATYLNAEIINADAVQIYKNVNIGSAKATKEEMAGITHHMIDFNPLNNKYTIYDYQKDGRKILNKLISDNKNVVVVGGSGLYIKALLYDYNLLEEDRSKTDMYDDLSNEELKKYADKIDSDNDIHINNRKRLLRFINHYESTKELIKNSEQKNAPLYDFTILGLEAEREQLYKKINNRVDDMFDMGLLEEAKELYSNKENTNSIIGYKELNKYFEGILTLEEAKEEIKKNSRRYAKRQYTWFKNQFSNIHWINVNYENFNETIEESIKIIKR